MPQPIRRGNSFQKVAVKIGEKSKNAAKKLSKFATLNDEKKFHFDFFMSVPGLWMQSIKDYLPPDPNETPIHPKIARRRKMLRMAWCIGLGTLVFWPTWIRWAVAWVWSSESATQWLQDWSAVLGGSRYYHLPCLSNWSLNGVSVLSQWWYAQYSNDVYKLIKPMIAVHYPKEARALGINLTPNEMRQLRIRYNFGAICVVYFAIWGGICGCSFCGIMWYMKFGYEMATSPWSLFMTLHTTLWGFFCPWMLCYQFLFLYITCYMYGLQLDRNLRDIKEVKKVIDTRRGRIRLDRVLTDYMKIMCEIESANKFWSRFLGVAYFVFVSNFTLLLFDVVFAPIPLMTKWLWFGIGSSHVQLVSFMAYSGDIASRKACRALQSLSSIHTENLPIRLKWKLRRVIEMSGANRIEISSYRVKRQTRWIGFWVFDLFVVSDNDYVDISVAVATYLLLFIQLTFF